MGYVVKFLRVGAAVYQFPAPAPFTSPKFAAEYANTQPPTLSSVLKTWDIEGILYGTQSATVTAWNALTAILGNPATLPDEVQLLDPTGAVIDRINSGTSYALFKIESIESPRSDLQWRGEMRFRVRVSARLVFALIGYGNGITDLDQRITWNYSAEGLLTQTVSGRLETIPGSSATDAAKALGLQLPGTAFGFITNGPGGVDVEQANLTNTKAAFTSTIQQSGATLPSGVTPDYSFSVEVSQASGETMTVRTVRARGAGAAGAVNAGKPTGPLVSSKVETDPARMSATGTFVTRNTSSGGTFVRLRQINIKGGGTPIRYTTRTGRRDPVPHELPHTPVEISERLTVIVRGVVAPNDLQIPGPMSGGGVIEDTDAMAFDPYWTRVEPGVTPQGDLWLLGLTRVYRAASVGDIAKLVESAAASVSGSALADAKQSTASAELGRKG